MKCLVTLAALIAGMVFTTNALALGGSAYAQISADWGTPGVVHVHVLSNHTFRGTVTTQCIHTAVTATDTNETKSLDAWYDNPVTHQNQDDVDFDITAAGSGANCTITVMDGRKQLAQQKFVSS
jgi:hypothetical protein